MKVFSIQKKGWNLERTVFCNKNAKSLDAFVIFVYDFYHFQHERMGY